MLRFDSTLTDKCERQEGWGSVCIFIIGTLSGIVAYDEYELETMHDIPNHPTELAGFATRPGVLRIPVSVNGTGMAIRFKSLSPDIPRWC